MDFTAMTTAANVPVTAALVGEAKVVLAGIDGSSFNDAAVKTAEALIAPWIAMIIATVVACHRIDRTAGWCLMPLAAWVCFGTVLNFAIWKLNS
jgi:hypothetical protein